MINHMISFLNGHDEHIHIAYHLSGISGLES